MIMWNIISHLPSYLTNNFSLYMLGNVRVIIIVLSDECNYNVARNSE